MPELERLKKNKTMLHLDTSSNETPEWTRVGKSTVFNLETNAQTETNDFIEDEMATTEIMRYEPGISQELQTNKGDPAFDAIYAMLYNLPTGEEVKKNFLFTFAGNIGSEDTPKYNAWKTQCTVNVTNFDSVAEKIYFELTINKITRGTVTVASGVPTFVATEE